MRARIAKFIAAITAVITVLLSFQPLVYAAPVLTSPPRMRPYSGIGVLMLDNPTSENADMAGQLLYEEPAINRIGAFDASRAPKHDWIFGATPDKTPLIVIARRGNWLRVTYDDAGREAWLATSQKSGLTQWDAFLKGRNIHLLPGLQKRYYQLFHQQGKRPAVSIPSRQSVKVIKVVGDWAMVISSLNALHWLRWRDEDGRLLVGL